MQKVEIDNNEIEAGAELGPAQHSWSWIRLTEAGSSGVVRFIVSKAKRNYICMCEVNIKLDSLLVQNLVVFLLGLGEWEGNK